MPRKKKPSNIVLLKTPAVRANESVVELLKVAMKDARAGLITQAVLIIEGPSKVAWRCSELIDINSLIGMLERTKCELVLSIADEIGDEDAPTG
jgi:hypothetical protein